MVSQPRKPPRTAVKCPATRQRATLRLSFVLVALVSPRHAVAQIPSSSSQQSEKVRGTVVNGLTHEPLGRALVFSNDNRFAAMSDDQGRFEFTFSISESASSDSTGAIQRSLFIDRPSALMARKPGFLEPDGGVPVPPPGEATDLNLTINLTPEALILGQIQLPTADYLSRMQVELYHRSISGGQEQWQVVKAENSRADGSFRFAELSPGDYKLVTRESLDRDPVNFDPGGQLFGYAPVYYPSAIDFESAQTIHLTPGAIFQANLSPIRSPYYQVRIAVANPPAGLQVEVWPLGRPSPGFSLGYNPREKVIAGTLPDGSYTIHAFGSGDRFSAGSTNITVKGGPSSDASMVLLPNASIVVNVREEFQKPDDPNTHQFVPAQGSGNSRRPSYLNVNLFPVAAVGYAAGAGLRPPAGPEDEAMVIENVRPGRYRVDAHSSVGYISAIRMGDTDLLHAPLQIDSGSSPPPMEIHVRDDGADVEGMVSDISTAGSRGTFLGVSPNVYFLPAEDSTGQFRMTWVGPDGHFEQHQLPPGAYRVLALDQQDPELQYASREALARYDSAMQTIEVAPGQKTQVRVSLARRTQ